MILADRAGQGATMQQPSELLHRHWNYALGQCLDRLLLACIPVAAALQDCVLIYEKQEIQRLLNPYLREKRSTHF